MRSLASLSSLSVALTSALLLATPACAVDPAADHAAHHPAAGTTVAQADTAAPAATDTTTPAARMQTLRDRMQQMRRTRDPAARMKMMEEHMTQMEAVMKDMEAGCPMAGKGGPGMRGGMGMGMGMMGGPGMGPGMGPGGGMAMQGDPMTAKRLDALEKRVDMMQMLLQQKQPAPPARP